MESLYILKLKATELFLGVHLDKVVQHLLTKRKIPASNWIRVEQSKTRRGTSFIPMHGSIMVSNHTVDDILDGSRVHIIKIVLVGVKEHIFETWLLQIVVASSCNWSTVVNDINRISDSLPVYPDIQNAYIKYLCFNK